MQLNEKIKIDKKVQDSFNKLSVHFDDPPGPSPGRWFDSLFDLKFPVSSLRDDFTDKVSDIEVGGIISGA